MTNQNNAPAKRQPSDPLVAAMENGGRQAIARALGDTSKAERFARVALTTIRKSQQLSKCDPMSIMGALMHCASFDMEPDARGLVWLVPYKNECQFQLGYKGMIELAMRSGQVTAIYADVVYEAEAKAGLFHYIGGTDRKIVHERDITRPELRAGKVIAAYAVAEMASGGKIMELCDRAYLDKRQNASQSARSSSSPWTQWYEEMAKKTAVKALCRTLPQSVEKLHRAIAVENEYEAKVIETERERMSTASTLNAMVLGDDAEAAQDSVQSEPASICPISGKPADASAAACRSGALLIRGANNA